MMTFDGHEDIVNAVISIPKTTLVISGSSDSYIRVWDYEAFECIKEINADPTYVLAYLGGSEIASGGEDCLVKIWNYKTGVLGY